VNFPKVALIDQTKDGVVPHDDLVHYAAALQQQVDNDLAPVWGVRADISVPEAGDDIPHGTWPLRIVDSLPSVGGVHLDHQGQPYAEVVFGAKLSIAISHELLEMLVDPQGNRFTPAIDCDPYSAGQRVFYLVEVCDPCEVTSYEINGVPVSDFICPAFYDAYAEGPFDLRGALAAPLPRQVPQGCYISWIDPLDWAWHQQRPDGTFVIANATPGANPRDDRDSVLAQADLHNIPAIYGAWA
jgi:hypothetical protein